MKNVTEDQIALHLTETEIIAEIIKTVAMDLNRMEEERTKKIISMVTSTERKEKVNIKNLGGTSYKFLHFY